MSNTYSYEQIRQATTGRDFTAAIESAFVAYSQNRAVVPPVGELNFTEPPGDTHIKYGYLKGADHFVVKIASGFYQNPSLGLPSSSGVMLVFSARTGQLKAVLMDQGYLTDLRTALAGRIAASYLAPKRIEGIGVYGTGIQARMQVEALLPLTPCRQLVVWGRSAEKLAAYKAEMEQQGWLVTTTLDRQQPSATCNLLITATPATEPLLQSSWIRPGTHITAMGADTPGKQELEAELVARCDLVVADSRIQCGERGEIAKALQSGLMTSEPVAELGEVIDGQRPGRVHDMQITLADLTGVAVQDIAIATEVCRILATQTAT